VNVRKEYLITTL